MEALIHRLYARLQTRYLIAFQVWMLVVAVVTAAMTLAAASRTSRSLVGQVLKVAPIWGATIVIAFVIIGTRLRRRFSDAIAWIRGNRTTENAQAVWENLASETYKLVVFGTITFSLLSIPPLLIGSRILDVPWYGLVAFGLAIEFTILIAALLDYLGVEVLARPILREVALYLPRNVRTGHPSPSLRWRLGVGMTITSLYGVLLGSAIASGTDSPVLKLLLGLSFALFMSGTLVLFIATLLGTAVLSPMNDIVRAMRGVGQGDLGGRVAILGADEVGFLARGFNSMVSGLAEREVLRSAMGAYIDPHVTERILSEGAELEGDELDVSVIFVDIRDFTDRRTDKLPRETVRIAERLLRADRPDRRRARGPGEQVPGRRAPRRLRCSGAVRRSRRPRCRRGSGHRHGGRRPLRRIVPDRHRYQLRTRRRRERRWRRSPRVHPDR